MVVGMYCFFYFWDILSCMCVCVCVCVCKAYISLHFIVAYGVVFFHDINFICLSLFKKYSPGSVLVNNLKETINIVSDLCGVLIEILLQPIII